VDLLVAVGVEVVASVPTGVELLAALGRAAADVAIVDMRMPPTRTNEGLLAAREIKASYPRTGVLVFTADTEAPYAAELFEDGQAGVGYMLKDNIADRSALKDALVRIAAGHPVIDSDIAARLLARPARRGRLASLTDREREILALMAEGLSNNGIARRIHLSAKTVEAYLTSIFTKLGIGSDLAENRRVMAVLAWLKKDATG
jgi:DNA-binding NarL/FixJ family response regulator